MKREERICTYIDKEVYEKFKEYCNEHRKKMSSAILDLIVDELVKNKYLKVRK